MSRAKRQHIRRNRRRRAINRWATQAARWINDPTGSEPVPKTLDEVGEYGIGSSGVRVIYCDGHREGSMSLPGGIRDTPLQAFRDAAVWGIGAMRIKGA